MIFKSLLCSFFILSTASAKTLIITDSHGEGAFGAELVRLLEEKKENVSLYAVGGSTAADWVMGLNQIWGYWEYHTGKTNIRSMKPKTPEFKKILELNQPDQVIIELGTNLIWRDLNTLDTRYIIELLKNVSDIKARCFWIGPPNLRPKSQDQKRRVLEIHQLLEKEIPTQHCKLIAGWNFTHYPSNGGDGIHYDQIPGVGAALAQDWARKAVEELP